MATQSGVPKYSGIQYNGSNFDELAAAVPEGWATQFDDVTRQDTGADGEIYLGGRYGSARFNPGDWLVFLPDGGMAIMPNDRFIPDAG